MAAWWPLDAGIGHLLPLSRSGVPANRGQGCLCCKKKALSALLVMRRFDDKHRHGWEEPEDQD